MSETAYCVKCDEKVPIRDPRRVVFRNQRTAIQGTCPTCGTRVTRITGKAT